MAKRTKAQLRNLVQYRELSDEEFSMVWKDYISQEDFGSEEEEVKRIEEIMNEFAQDYDLSDMNINDKIGLEQIAKMTYEIEQLQKMQSQARRDNSITRISAIDRVLKNLISNVSQLSNDLNISRKNRESDKGETLDEYLPLILKKARSFYQERLAYIYCPKCKMLVCNAWFTNWSDPNKLIVVCPREGCRHQFEVTSEELAKGKNKNIDGVLYV